MSELIRAIAGRLREYVGNRRRARRFPMNLEVKITLLDRVNGKDVVIRAPKVDAHTCDVSSDGLGLIVRSIRSAEHYLMGDKRVLRVVLESPLGPVSMSCQPVRYEKLDEESETQGYMLGVGIQSVEDDDLATWEKYLGSLL